jgi:hypothetical protein
MQYATNFRSGLSWLLANRHQHWRSTLSRILCAPAQSIPVPFTLSHRCIDIVPARHARDVLPCGRSTFALHDHRLALGVVPREGDRPASGLGPAKGWADNSPGGVGAATISTHGGVAVAQAAYGDSAEVPSV